MNLNEKELEIINAIYDMRENDLDLNYVPNIAPNEEKAKYRELVFYLNKLEGYGLININRYDNGRFYPAGGWSSEIYKNAALAVPDWSRIRISLKGKVLIEENRMKKSKKIKRYFTIRIKAAFEKGMDDLVSYIMIFLFGVFVGNIDKVIEFIKNIFN